MSPVSPLWTLPGVRLKVSQIDAVRPPSAAAPSIWYAAVAAPQTKPAGKPVRTGEGRASTDMSPSGRSGWGSTGAECGSALDGALHDAADDLPAEQREHQQHRQGAQQRAGHHDRLVRDVALAERLQRH